MVIFFPMLVVFLMVFIQWSEWKDSVKVREAKIEQDMASVAEQAAAIIARCKALR